MATDLIADLLTRIRNSQVVGHSSVEVRASKQVERVLNVLKSEGFVGGFRAGKGEGRNNGRATFIVDLKYYDGGQPLISVARRMSRSGRRMYVTTDRLPRVDSGLGIGVVSTSQGVISDKEARMKKIGGELLLLVG